MCSICVSRLSCVSCQVLTTYHHHYHAILMTQSSMGGKLKDSQRQPHSWDKLKSKQVRQDIQIHSGWARICLEIYPFSLITHDVIHSKHNFRPFTIISGDIVPPNIYSSFYDFRRLQRQQCEGRRSAKKWYNFRRLYRNSYASHDWGQAAPAVQSCCLARTQRSRASCDVKLRAREEVSRGVGLHTSVCVREFAC